MSQNQQIHCNGQTVLLGDHTHVIKDGGRMPSVVALRDTSETQSKPSYFRGQCWGAIGLLTGSLSNCFCTPLHLQLHQGHIHLGPSYAETIGNNAYQLVQMALDFARQQNQRCLLVLDAFFSTATVFKRAQSVNSIDFKAPFLTILTRAKKNYVAYFPAKPKPKGRPGPQPQYGEKITLMECFDHLDYFTEAECPIYGKRETIRYLSMTLMWKPIAQPLLFIWAITSRGPIVLMTSDLSLPPLMAIPLYCARVRIETLFDVLKNVLHAFRFRFWTRHLPKHSRRPMANRHLKSPQTASMETVKACWEAYERFVFCAMVAQGVLQMIALKLTAEVWEQHSLYLRTQSRELPSEKTTRQVIAVLIHQELFKVSGSGIIHEIQCQFRRLSDKNYEKSTET